MLDSTIEYGDVIIFKDGRTLTIGRCCQDGYLVSSQGVQEVHVPSFTKVYEIPNILKKYVESEMVMTYLLRGGLMCFLDLYR